MPARSLIASLLLLAHAACAYTVTGRVTDPRGQPLAGLRVRTVAGEAAVTDAAGQFAMEATSRRPTQVVAYDDRRFVTGAATERRPALDLVLPDAMVANPAADRELAATLLRGCWADSAGEARVYRGRIIATMARVAPAEARSWAEQDDPSDTIGQRNLRTALLAGLVAAPEPFGPLTERIASLPVAEQRPCRLVAGLLLVDSDVERAARLLAGANPAKSGDWLHDQLATMLAVRLGHDDPATRADLERIGERWNRTLDSAPDVLLAQAYLAGPLTDLVARIGQGLGSASTACELALANVQGLARRNPTAAADAFERLATARPARAGSREGVRLWQATLALMPTAALERVADLLPGREQANARLLTACRAAPGEVEQRVAQAVRSASDEFGRLAASVAPTATRSALRPDIAESPTEPTSPIVGLMAVDRAARTGLLLAEPGRYRLACELALYEEVDGGRLTPPMALRPELSSLRALAHIDRTRAAALADGFQLPDTRILTRLAVAEELLVAGVDRYLPQWPAAEALHSLLEPTNIHPQFSIEILTPEEAARRPLR